MTAAEEVVPFEPWMVDSEHPEGITITLDGKDWSSPSSKSLSLLFKHPDVIPSFFRSLFFFFVTVVVVAVGCYVMLSYYIQ